MGYQKVYETITSKVDGLKLDVLTLIPDGNIKGVFQIHHGMSEYKERYLPFMEYLTDCGYVTVIHDCRGHGKSIRKKEDLGYMYGAGGWGLVEDAHQITLEMKKRWPECPYILFGHSMGSLVVRAYAKNYDRDIDMLMVCGSPSKRDSIVIGSLIAKAEKLLISPRYRSKILELASFGAYAKKFSGEESKFAWCCSDKKVVKAYDESSLCGFNFTVDGYEALFELMVQVYSETGWKMQNPSMPVLFIGGGEDPCIGNVRKFAQAVQHMRLRGYKDTKGKIYPGMRHEILNETENDKVFRDITKYMKKYFQ